MDASKFFHNIMKYGESDHGSTPVVTHDSREANLPLNQRSYDIGYGHKIKESEWMSGKINGVKFYDETKGTFIPLTTEQKVTVGMADFEVEVQAALKNDNWKTNWNSIEAEWKLPLVSLAYNVGGNKAGTEWKSVLTAAKDKNIKEFAKHLRRKDNDKNTEGMDNRAVKELYYAGLIKSIDDVKDVLPLATAENSGVPQSTKDSRVVTMFKNVKTKGE